jgi:hypothetical protein
MKLSPRSFDEELRPSFRLAQYRRRLKEAKRGIKSLERVVKLYDDEIRDATARRKSIGPILVGLRKLVRTFEARIENMNSDLLAPPPRRAGRKQ